MATRILFVVMSAVHRPDAIDQLAAALHPHHVLVHHDFRQSPDFTLRAPNVSFVPEPRRTGWAVWGFVDGIFHSLRHALAHHTFDYVQLLSPTCLPVRPLAEFEEWVAQDRYDAHFGCVELDRDDDALMSVGYRAFAQQDTLRHRLLRRLMMTYYAGSPWLKDVGGIQLHTLAPPGGTAPAPTAVQRACLQVMRLARRGVLGRHPFRGGFTPCFASTWFGARRAVVERIVQRFEQPDIQSYFRSVRIADEFLVPSLLRLSGARRGPSNHYIHTFDGPNPGWIDVQDLPALRASGAFFARKFMDDPDLPVRRRVLQELVRVNLRRPAERPVMREEVAGLAP